MRLIVVLAEAIENQFIKLMLVLLVKERRVLAC